MTASKNTINILEHRRLVASYIEDTVLELFKRAIAHDESKFSAEEFDLYEEALPKFEQTVYGTEEYKQVCRDIKPAIKHHITSNRHHPEYFGDKGVNGMTLIDLLEMSVDWLAASQRNSTNNLNIDKGLEINKDRYGISDQLFEVIKNTIDWLQERR
jgi:hypothetical protein